MSLPNGYAQATWLGLIFMILMGLGAGVAFLYIWSSFGAEINWSFYVVEFTG